MVTFLYFFVALATLVFVHELGHFLAAKVSGIRVDEFGLGFPPRLFGFKKGETEYTLNAIPFGGFVKIFGEDGATGASARDPRSFVRKNRVLQVFTVVAGVLGNFLFAWALFTTGYMIGLPTPADALSAPENVTTVITEIVKGSPGEKAGLERGDTIYFGAGKTLSVQENPTPDDIHTLVEKEKTGVIALGIRSPGESKTRTVLLTPEEGIVPGRKALGIGMTSVVNTKLAFFPALFRGAETTYYTTKSTISGLYTFVKNFALSLPQETSITGPVGLVSVVGESRSLGLAYLISLIAALSVNLGVVNLVPFPALDGGRIVVILIEGVLRRELSPKVVGFMNQAGLALLLLLMFVVTIKDIIAL